MRKEKVRHTDSIMVLSPGHPRADCRGYVREHILIAELVMGEYLPIDAVVHHINKNFYDNRPKNLVVCQDNSYHRLIHTREEAIKACGKPTWRQCSICHEHDNPINLYIKNNSCYHKKCKKGYDKERYNRT